MRRGIGRANDLSINSNVRFAPPLAAKSRFAPSLTFALLTRMNDLTFFRNPVDSAPLRHVSARVERIPTVESACGSSPRRVIFHYR